MCGGIGCKRAGDLLSKDLQCAVLLLLLWLLLWLLWRWRPRVLLRGHGDTALHLELLLRWLLSYRGSAP